MKDIPQRSQTVVPETAKELGEQVEAFLEENEPPGSHMKFAP
jgi:hypothetical protein